MRFIIGEKVICNKGRLEKILLEAYESNTNEFKPNLYHYLLGCYNSSWFGICIYNNIEIKDKKPCAKCGELTFNYADIGYFCKKCNYENERFEGF